MANFIDNDINSHMDRYAVVGNPIGHSKSPAIHTAFAEHTDQEMSYTAELVELDAFPESIMAFFGGGGKGLNVTVPFKEEAWELAVKRTDRAELAGAVNTLYLNDEGQICGDNTDGAGIMRDITHNHGFSLNNKRVLVLGAGGAVRGIMQPLLAAQPSSVTIANRTVSKAQTLVDMFADLGVISACGFTEVEGRFDLIINGTSASLQGDLPPLPVSAISSNTWCYDMMYGSEPTAFMQWANANGSEKQIDGLGMLVEQAAEAFEIWRGVKPDSLSVIHQIRNALGNENT